MKECSVKGCHNAGETKGLCNRHYLATRRDYQKQYYLRKKAEKEFQEVTPGVYVIGQKLISDLEHISIGLVAQLEQAKSKQGQRKKSRKASSPDSHGVGL